MGGPSRLGAWARATVPEDLRYRFDRWMIDGPRRGGPYARLRHRYELTAFPSAKLVVEGFPRSSNTYAYSAFCLVNGVDPAIRPPNHSIRNVLIGAQRGLPVILLTRPPLDAVASQLLQRPQLEAPSILRSYIRFHTRALPVLDRVVVAPFDSVVHSFGAVITEVNRRFGTSFVPYEPTEENERRVREHVDRWDFIESGWIEVREHTASRPSKERQQQKPAVVARIRQRAALLAHAETVYNRVMTGAAWVEHETRHEQR